MNDRARVPFALVGVLLLVSSSTLAATRTLQPSATTDPSVERAIEGVRAELVATLRATARREGRQAAAAPVVAPADTVAGRALSGADPFRASLRLRIAAGFARDVAAVSDREGDVVVQARFPVPVNASTLEESLARVRVERAGPNRTALRVRVTNVSVVARRGESVVERVTVSPDVVVGTPVLFAHDAVRRYEDRLNAPATAPGFGRRLTARLYPLAWARGYAQYGGAGIVNVVGNRHVGVAANDAVLATQRSVFGVDDPEGRRGLRRAGTRVAATDLVNGVGLHPEVGTRVGEVVTAHPADRTAGGAGPAPETPMNVSVGTTADEALLGFTRHDVGATLRAAYTVRARLDVRVTNRATTVRGQRRPGDGWSLLAERTETRVRVTPFRTAPLSHEGWHELRRAGRRVVRVRTTERRWGRDDRVRTTRLVRRTTARVRVAVLGDHTSSPVAPPRPIRGVHEPGGPLVGDNLLNVPARASARLVDRRGGVDAIAERALGGAVNTSAVPVVGTRPVGLDEWVGRDLAGFSRRVRAVEAAVPRGRVGTYRVAPAAALAERIRDRRDQLVDAPATYASVADRARIAVRVAYLDRVLSRLDRQARRADETRDRFVTRLAEHGVSLTQLSAVEESRRRVRRPDRRRASGLGGSLHLAVDGAPAYLSLQSVDATRIDARRNGTVTPLAARNLNVFTLPYADAADTVSGRLFGPDRVRLRSAARALEAAERVPPAATTPAFRTRRVRLRAAITNSLTRVRDRYRKVLRRQRAGDGRTERRSAVVAGLSGWRSPASRALAVANGSAGAKIADVARRRGYVETSLAAARLRAALRTAGSAAADRPAFGVPAGVVNGTATATRAAWYRTAAEEAVTSVAENATRAATRRARSRLERRLGRSLARVPAGLPVTPLPTHWYATANVWVVSVRGRYERFTLRTGRGPPGRSVAYTRDGRPVRFDWDGDGERDLVGRAARVGFETRTVVAVVVPPGGQGVGDVDGNADERSSGWKSNAFNRRSPRHGHVPRGR